MQQPGDSPRPNVHCKKPHTTKYIPMVAFRYGPKQGKIISGDRSQVSGCLRGRGSGDGEFASGRGCLQDGDRNRLLGLGDVMWLCLLWGKSLNCTFD